MANPASNLTATRNANAQLEGGEAGAQGWAQLREGSPTSKAIQGVPNAQWTIATRRLGNENGANPEEEIRGVTAREDAIHQTSEGLSEPAGRRRARGGFDQGLEVRVGPPRSPCS